MVAFAWNWSERLDPPGQVVVTFGRFGRRSLSLRTPRADPPAGFPPDDGRRKEARPAVRGSKREPLKALDQRVRLLGDTRIGGGEADVYRPGRARRVGGPWRGLRRGVRVRSPLGFWGLTGLGFEFGRGNSEG